MFVDLYKGQNEVILVNKKIIEITNKKIPNKPLTSPIKNKVNKMIETISLTALSKSLIFFLNLNIF